MSKKPLQLIKNYFIRFPLFRIALASACFSVVDPSHLTGGLPGKTVGFMFRATAYKKCISQKSQAFLVIKVLADVSHRRQSSLHYKLTAVTALGLPLHGGSGRARGKGDRKVK